MTSTFYPIGTQVILTGLQAAPEHNGKQGIVESTTGERQRVRLLDQDEEKVLAIRPKNLQLAPRSSDTLSVKELKAILRECNDNAEATTTGMDKRDLQSAVADVCTPERIAEILMQQAQKQQKVTSSSMTSSTPTTSAIPTFSKEQMEAAADRMSTMDPAQMRQQAQMMRAMPPDQLRRSNPMFSNMSGAQIQQMISQFEMMASNPAMMAQAAQQMKSMSPEDLERQRQAVMGSTAASSSSSSATTTTPTTSTSSGAATTATPPPLNTSADMLRQMNPEQIKQQAAMLKSMPPQQIRSMHPQFSNMSDAQIQQMAAQMELMADNPAMMKMAAETMQNMSPEQMAEIQQGRMPSGAGGGGGADSGNAAMPSMDQAANLLSSMSGKQVKDMLKMAKENPDMFKSGMPGGTDTTQMSSMINRIDSMDEATLDRILAFLKGLQKVVSPFIRAYQSANQAVDGHLLKLVGVSFAALIAYRWFGGVASSSAPASLVEDIPLMDEQQTVETREPSEFDEF